MEYYSTMKKEQNTGKYYNMDVPRKHYATWHKLDPKGKGCTVLFIRHTQNKQIYSHGK